MPANLSPDYHAAEARFRAASSAEERIAALEEMLRVIPKHKGTEKLQADLKSRLSKLRQKPAGKGGPRTHSHHIPPEGAGQIVLVGPPNTGKSSLVKRLTHAEPEVADYPYTTREATPGMMAFEDVQFQLIDLPPLSDEHVEPWVFDLARGCDLAWIVVDVANSLDGIALVKRILGDKRIALAPPGAGPGEDAGVVRPALVVVTGRDRPEAREDLEIARALMEEPWPLFPVSSVDGSGLAELGKATFDALGIVRVYTKQPGKPPDTASPFTLPVGATVGDLAERIHKDLLETLKFARIWGPSAHDGQTVHRDHVLAEGDVVEIHA
jgi:ribosome-interacting GTPase 1